MTSVLTYDSLRLHSSTKNEQTEDDLLFSKFRVRLCKSEDIPILKDYSGVRQTEIILVDLPPNKDDELDSIRTEQFGDHQTPMEVDTGSGDGPLVFNFLSLAVLEQRCDTDDKRLAMKRPIMSSSYLECNPLDAPTAFAVRDRLLRGNLTSGMDDKLSAVPVWIVVNAKDHLGTTFVGSHLTNSKVSTFHTRCLGRYGEQCKNTIKLLDARFQGELEAKSKALALYSVLDKNVSPAWGSGRYLSKMKLTFKWDAKAANYLCAPPPSASAVFYFSPGWKDKRVALVEATEQLEYLLVSESSAQVDYVRACINHEFSLNNPLLCVTAHNRLSGICDIFQMMANVLDSGSEMVWPSGADGVQDAILSDVRQLIAEHKVQNNDAERTAHGMRHVDFTELLWDILKRCTDYKTLVAALNVVFDALKQCRINAILHEDNKSSIARLMRDAQSQDLMLPRLEALTPIQILLEIGYERFRRDMVQAYVTAGFMTNDTDLDLKPQLNSSPENRTRALLPLHLALQTMLEMKQYLALPAHTLASTTRSVIAKYSSSPITDITKVFYETAVSFIHVQPELLKKLPDLWTYETTYSHGSSVVAQTFIHFTRDIKLRYLESKVSFEREDGDGDQENQDRESAFVCTYTTASF